MNNLFAQSRSHWVRYDRYEIKTGKTGKRYITPEKTAKPDIYNPLKGIESSWSVSGDRTMVALTMTFADEPMAKTMSFQREYAEAYDWVAQQLKDWAFTLTTSILYYNDYDLIDEDTRNLYRKGMAAFGGIAPSYHIELLDKPTIYWDFHSLLLGIQMMFSFLLVDGEKPLRLCKHCQKVFLSSRSNSAFCSPRCKNQYNVYKSRGKKTSEED